MAEIIELSPTVSLNSQLQSNHVGAIVLVTIFTVDLGCETQFIEAWAEDAKILRAQPGFISAQFHRAIADSPVFLNYAVWESTEHFARARKSIQGDSHVAKYPKSTVASPHLFEKFAVPGVCVGS